MKQNSPEAQNLKRLLERLDAEHHPDDPPATQPVSQLVIGLLQYETTRKQAETAFSKLMNQLVDINELRVTHDREVLGIIGQNYPQAEERIARLQEVLNEIFVREYAVAMHSIADSGKKEQRAYLDSLPALPPYVAAQVTLLSFGGHALPVDEKLVALLVQDEILEADTPLAQAESTLLRQVKAAEATHVHMLLQAWADANRSPRKKSQSGSKKKTSKKTTRSAEDKTRGQSPHNGHAETPGQDASFRSSPAP